MTTYASIPAGMNAAELDELFAANMAKGEAEKQAVMNRAVPAFLQQCWGEYYGQLTGFQATVTNGQVLTVNDASRSSQGVIGVGGGTIGVVTMVSTTAFVQNNDNVVVHSAADANLAGSPGKATLASGVFTKVMLTV